MRSNAMRTFSSSMLSVACMHTHDTHAHITYTHSHHMYTNPLFHSSFSSFSSYFPRRPSMRVIESRFSSFLKRAIA